MCGSRPSESLGWHERGRYPIHRREQVRPTRVGRQRRRPCSRSSDGRVLRRLRKRNNRRERHLDRHFPNVREHAGINRSNVLRLQCHHGQGRSPLCRCSCGKSRVRTTLSCSLIIVGRVGCDKPGLKVIFIQLPDGANLRGTAIWTRQRSPYFEFSAVCGFNRFSNRDMK